MKVLLINGSPRKSGNTFLALSEVSERLSKQGIDSEIVQLGVSPVRGCVACYKCKKKGDGCVFDDDLCNRVHEKMAHCDGLIIGAPVYYGLSPTVRRWHWFRGCLCPPESCIAANLQQQ